MSQRTVDISIEDEEKLAKFVAQLVREGVRFDVLTYPDTYIVRLTGGY